MKILVIEDSVLLADTIAEALQNENYAVDIANDGQLGYEHASTGIYDMVILDLMLPKMNGYEVLSALRRDGDNVPVLILSAKTEIDDKIQGFTTGADDYIPNHLKFVNCSCAYRRSADAAIIRILHTRSLEISPTILLPAKSATHRPKNLSRYPEKKCNYWNFL